MDISAGLIAKAVAGAAAASATVAGIVFKDELGSLFFKSEVDGDQSRQGEAGGGGGTTNNIPDSRDPAKTINLTEWDNALIEKAENPGIQFTSNSEEITGTFDSDSQTQTITLSVAISDRNLPDLKSKNNNNDWGWECAIVFKREKSSRTEVKDDLKTSFKNFLGKIKSVESENKDLKIEFIKKCAGFRGGEADKALKTIKDLGSWPNEAKSSGQDDDVIQEDNKIKSEKIFTLVDDEETGSNKLKIKDEEKDEFDRWFAS